MVDIAYIYALYNMPHSTSEELLSLNIKMRNLEYSFNAIVFRFGLFELEIWEIEQFEREFGFEYFLRQFICSRIILKRLITFDVKE